jgi:hypothetical protein
MTRSQWVSDAVASGWRSAKATKTLRAMILTDAI